MNATAVTLKDRRRLALERLEADRRGGTRHRRLPRSHRVEGPPTTAFYAIALVATGFVMLGLVMVLSASATSLVNEGRSPYSYFNRQVMWAVCGFAGMWVAMRIRYDAWRRFSLPLLGLALVGMALPFLSPIGVTVDGAQAWIRIGSITMQPSELLKVAVVIAAADLLARRVDVLHDTRRALLPIALLGALAAGSCLVQGDLGAAIVLGAIVLGAAFIGGLPLTPLLGLAGSALAAMTLFVVSSPRRMDRFTALFDITGQRDHRSYQTYQGFLSIANGGVLGSGIGEGKGKLGYLPLAHSDFMFAVIADELGLVGAFAVLGGFGLLAYFGVQTALAAPDRFGMVLAGGISVWFAMQTIVNVGGVTGLLPVTGLTLPFFSVGGTSLFVSITAAGLLLNVARRAT
ncbi:MAG: putative lipid II flippase FtsW [Actinomycetota bacterium]|nr:putative lipid II flippase FtsW [Actinomycetota bacterium]